MGGVGDGLTYLGCVDGRETEQKMVRKRRFQLAKGLETNAVKGGVAYVGGEGATDAADPLNAIDCSFCWGRGVQGFTRPPCFSHPLKPGEGQGGGGKTGRGGMRLGG